MHQGTAFPSRKRFSVPWCRGGSLRRYERLLRNAAPSKVSPFMSLRWHREMGFVRGLLVVRLPANALPTSDCSLLHPISGIVLDTASPGVSGCTSLLPFHDPRFSHSCTAGNRVAVQRVTGRRAGSERTPEHRVHHDRRCRLWRSRKLRWKGYPDAESRSAREGRRSAHRLLSERAVLHWKPEFSPLRHGFDYFYGFKAGFIDFYTHTTPDTPGGGSIRVPAIVRWPRGCGGEEVGLSSSLRQPSPPTPPSSPPHPATHPHPSGRST